MNELTSLPQSLRDHIQEAASSLLANRPATGPELTDPTQKVIAEMARQYPELFALLVIANSGFTGIELVETEERREDKLVGTGFDNYMEVKPMTTKRTVRREVRFLNEKPGKGGKST